MPRSSGQSTQTVVAFDTSTIGMSEKKISEQRLPLRYNLGNQLAVRTQGGRLLGQATNKTSCGEKEGRRSRPKDSVLLNAGAILLSKAPRDAEYSSTMPSVVKSLGKDSAGVSCVNA